jgi:hypothetical protein
VGAARPGVVTTANSSPARSSRSTIILMSPPSPRRPADTGPLRAAA